MKKLGNILFSMATAVVLMLIFAVAIGWATFIESAYGTETAKKLVYVAPWFEVLLGLIAINLTGNVIKNKLYKPKKWTILLFHLAFLLILGGGAITRHISYEGTMHIREGESSDIITLSHTYLTMEASYKGVNEKVSRKIRLTHKGSNRYTESLEIGGRKVNLETELFLPNAEQVLKPSNVGLPGVSLFIMDMRKAGHEFDLLQGEKATVDMHTYSFDPDQPGMITFLYDQNKPQFISKSDVIVTSMMAKGDTTILAAGERHDAMEKTIYRGGGHVFVIKSFMPHAEKSISTNTKMQTGSQGLVVSVSTDNASDRISLINQNGDGIPTETRLDDIDLKVYFGSITKKLPFSVQLKDFDLERYPGSHSPSSYASDVVLNDPQNNTSFPFRIYMNHILKYDGFRFFQSSYDQDEKGTILSVSHDYWGTFVSYLGYFLLGLGMVLTLFNRNSKLRSLIRQSSEIRKLKRAALPAILLLMMVMPATTFANNPADFASTKKEHIKELNSLLVQDKNGRVEPFATLTSELMRKLYKKETYDGLSSTEVILGMMTDPTRWQDEPIIKISNGSLAKQLGAPSGYISYHNMFDNSGDYKLQKLVSSTYQKDPNTRNKYDKEVINLDERINICYQIYNNSFFKFFPLPDDDRQNWTTAQTFPSNHLGEGESSPVQMYNAYLQEAAKAMSSGNWSNASSLLLSIKTYQLMHGSKIIPSSFKIKSEVLYSKLNLFGKLSRIYQTVGLILLIINLLTVFKPRLSLKYVNGGAILVSALIFALHTAGIGLRWYISGHAPWSNGYETMIFVGWATALAGMIFARQSGITLAVTNLLAGIMLMVASFSWMNPEITPLVPVLKSYWLIVHVAVITSSYGFLAIGALLALLNLILITFKTNNNRKNIELNIREISIIIEISLIIGLILLTAGAFLGGIWANESWGRYWGWDPKETWALVTILVYSIVLHLKKIPSFKSAALFNGLTLISFSSVLMTFFGVNYYLSGLHSYAQGDAPPIPNAVYITAILIIVIISAAYYKESITKVRNIKS
ncbi:cytochrome c biogenesis protein CcsA [Saccharicrinis sp. FJH62]|uniref:cytochrome c biogenesis protein CcsA n=1 Tax=Saccharicrinis sp. FJH62 TaxID=3344657 RepID=UPI0035D45F4F